MVNQRDYDFYRMLKASEGAEPFSEDEWVQCGLPARVDVIRKLAGRFEPSDEEWEAVREARGGCRCQDPGAMPPCSACSDPLNLREVEACLVLREAEQEAQREVTVPEGWGDW